MAAERQSGGEKGFLKTWWEKFTGFIKENPVVAGLVGVGLLVLA